jgi:hypothetical protein
MVPEPKRPFMGSFGADGVSGAAAKGEVGVASSGSFCGLAVNGEF